MPIHRLPSIEPRNTARAARRPRTSPLLALALATLIVLAVPPRSVEAQCLEGTLTPSDAAAEDRFGRALDSDGDFIVVGSIFDDDGGDRSGGAYVFRREPDGTWVEEAKLVSDDLAVDDQFGVDVAISGDVVVVGAQNDDDLADRSGSAYVFRRSEGGVWTQEAKLLAPDGAMLDFFGRAVAVHGDTALIGSHEDDDSGSNSGSAYVFRDDGAGNWSFEQKLVSPTARPLDLFGLSLDLDEDFAIIGATGDDEVRTDAGAAFVFVRDGTTWTNEAKLVDTAARNAAGLGNSVSIENGIAAVGASNANDAGNASGAVQVYARAGGGAWLNVARLTPADGQPQSFFGWQVAVDGFDIAVGAYRIRERSVRSGAVYLFVGDGQGTWTETAKLTEPTTADNDNLGFGLAMSEGRLAGGARLHDTPFSGAGTVWVWDSRSADCRCMRSRVNAGVGPIVDSLYVNGSTGGPTRTVTVGSTDLIYAYVLQPPGGGNGKFVIHANSGAPDPNGFYALPDSVGTACFPILIPLGAAPVAIWNNIGRQNQIGSSTDFGGNPIPDPAPAPTVFLQLNEGDPNLPPGTTITLQGAVIDPGSTSDKNGSMTNAVILVVE